MVFFVRLHSHFDVYTLLGGDRRIQVATYWKPLVHIYRRLNVIHITR